MQNYQTPSNLPKGKAKLINQQTDKISQQPKNWENRNGPDLVQAFPRKWWVESDFTAPNLPLWLKSSGCHYKSIFNNNGTKMQNVLTKWSSSYTIWFQMRCWMTSCLNHNYLILIFIHFHFMKIHRLLSSLQRQNIFRQYLGIGI